MSKLLKIAAPLALSVLAPGIGTALGSSILGAGAVGASTLGNALVGAGIGGLTGGGLKGALLGGAGGALGANLGSLGSEVYGPLQDGASRVVGQDGILGAIGKATGISGTDLPSIGGLVSGSGGGSTFGGANLLTSVLGGYQEDDALKKAQEQLLAGNNQQLQNLESFDPSGLGQDPSYKFQQEQGEKALNRSLGAQGNVFSGRALQEAAKFNTGLADQEFDDYYRRWLEKTNAQNSIYGNSGDVRAAGTIGRANSLSKALAGVFA